MNLLLDFILEACVRKTGFLKNIEIACTNLKTPITHCSGFVEKGLTKDYSWHEKSHLATLALGQYL